MTWNRNRLTEKLGIDYPIIQGPLGGLSSQRLTAAVSNFGGLGCFGALSLSAEEIKNVISQIRSLTSKPFAVNLWVSMEDDGARTSDEAAFNRSLAPLASYFSELNAPRPEYKPYSPIRFEDQARILLDERVPVFSFIFGIPPKKILDECRAKGIVTIGTATTPDEACALQDASVDAIVASGFEAGGHRGSFLRAAEDSVTGTFSLIPRIVDVVDVPVIAAGGIADARGVIAAFVLGAEAVQMGTAFLTCEESGASRIHRETLMQRKGEFTGLTTALTGRLARGIQNRLMSELNQKRAEMLPYPLQRMLVRNLSIAAEAAGRADLMPLWADRAANESALRTNLLSLETTRTRHVGNDPNVEWYDPDLWMDEFAFLSQPGQGDIQSDLFYDYRTNVEAYPKWQAWMREKQPRLLVIWGKYDLSFDLSEPERYRQDVPKAEVHLLDAGHFALDTAADEIAALVRGFVPTIR